MSKRADWPWNEISKSRIPAGKSGDWAVEKFSISEKQAQAHRWGCFLRGNGHRGATAGRFTRLVLCDCVIMSDTRAETMDHLDIYHAAKGDCLITGLGLGLITAAILTKPEVRTVTVIEQSTDVIKLVWDHVAKGNVRNRRARLIEADAMAWLPPKGMRFHTVWHDIWPTIGSEHWPEIRTLSRRFAPRLHRGGYQSAWAKELMRQKAEPELGVVFA